MNRYLILLVMLLGCSVADRRGQAGDVSFGADVVGEWVKLREGERLDHYTLKDQKIYCGEIACDVSPMEGVDIGTFEVNLGSQFARDKSHVYYPGQVTCVDGKDCGVCYCVKYILEGADPEDFVYLGKEYARDKESVFFRGQVLAAADAESFKVLKGPESFFFAVDQNRVFMYETIFEKADAATFYYDSLHPLTVKAGYNQVYVLRDKDHIWKFDPPNTLEELSKN
jgi:hypothetical protein